MNRVLAATAVAILLVVGVVAVRFFRGPDRTDYVGHNKRLLASLPLPRGATAALRQTLPVEKTVFGEQLSHTVGYTTYVSYDVPAELTAKALVRFYRRRLVHWHESGATVDGIPWACFDRHGATVSVQTDGMDPRTGPHRSFGLAVDYRGGTCD